MHHTCIAGFEVSIRFIPSPSKASCQFPSVRVLQRLFDFPNSLVCILAEAVSRGYLINIQSGQNAVSLYVLRNSCMIVYVFKRKALMVLLWQNFPIYFTKKNWFGWWKQSKSLRSLFGRKKIFQFFFVLIFSGNKKWRKELLSLILHNIFT